MLSWALLKHGGPGSKGPRHCLLEALLSRPSKPSPPQPPTFSTEDLDSSGVTLRPLVSSTQDRSEPASQGPSRWGHVLPSSSLEQGFCSGACRVGGHRLRVLQTMLRPTPLCPHPDPHPTPVWVGVLSSLPGPCPLCDQPASSPLQEVQKGLQDRGQEQSKRPFFLNVVQAVSQDGACVHAAADPRKGGEPSGY